MHKLIHSIFPASLRSKENWNDRMTSQEFDLMVACGAMVPENSVEALLGLEDKFSFGRGKQLYKLTKLNERLCAQPIEGGVPIEISPSGIAFRSQPDIFVQHLIKLVNFSLKSPEEGMPKSVFVATREFGDANYKIVLILDSQEIQTSMFYAWLKKQAKGQGGLLLIGPDLQSLLSFSADAQNIRPMELVCSTFLNDVREWLVEMSVSFESLSEIFPEKKVIVNFKLGRILVFNQRVNVKVGARPLRYLVGNFKMNGALSCSEFCRKFMEYHQDDANEHINGAKGELRKALKETFGDGSDNYKKADLLIMPKGPRNVVEKGLNAENMLLIEELP